MTGLIRERMNTLSKTDFSVIKFIEEKVAREDLINWAQSEDKRELRADLTPPVPFKLGDAIWLLIYQLMTP